MQDGGLTNVNIFWLDFNTCFLAGTKVLMSDGSYKKIEDVNVGDSVKSYNEMTGNTEDCRVADVFHHSPDEMNDYYLVINDNLKVTPNHRFYSNGEWIYAGNLKIGDYLFDYNQEEYLINSIEKVYDNIPIYDLEIEDCHTYFVSIDIDVDVLVHNEGGSIPSGNDPPNMPNDPTPSIGATNVNINTDLSWNGGDPNTEDQVQYVIFFGTSDPPPYNATTQWCPATQTTITYNSLDQLDYNTQYYWKIDAIDDYTPPPPGTAYGQLWSFTTENEPINNPPNTPSSPPTGPVSREVEQTGSYSTSTTDPNEDQVYYWFDWGDGNNSGWIGPYDSGATGNSSYSWSSVDTYDVKVKAKDVFGAESDWSPIISVQVYDNNPPDKPSQPSGFNSIAKNQQVSYVTSSTDEDGNQVYYLFDWGDGANSGWFGPYDSGATGSSSHSWSSVGTYDVKVKAKDVFGAESDWSPVFSVQVLEQDPKLRPDNDYIDQTKMRSIIVTDPENDDIFTINSEYNLEGTVIIDLYNNGLLIGSIWLFDSNSIECDVRSNDGVSNMVIENRALIESNNDVSTIKSPPITSVGNDVLSLNIVQLVTSSSGSSYSSNELKINLVSKGNGMTRTDTFNNIKSLKLQMYGDYEDTWLDFYNNEPNFNIENVQVSGETITNLEYNGADCSLMLFHSYILVDILN
jgi:hypothetical protein